MQRHGLLLAILLVAVGAARAQWQMEDSHTTADLRGIDNVGAGVAWASGTNGTVLRTEDGGYLWQACSIPPGAEHLDFRGVQAFDASTAIVMSSGKGDLSRLYKTTDGCQNWTLVLTNPDSDGFFDAVKFLGRQSGLVVGDQVQGIIPIFGSFDVGDSWHRWVYNRSLRPAKVRPRETLFAASNSALVVPGTEGALAFVTGGEGGSRFFNFRLNDFFDQGGYEAFVVEPLAFTKGPTSGAFSINSGGAVKNAPGLMVVGGDFMKPDQPSTAAFLPPRNGGCYGLMPQRRIDAATPPHGFRSAVAYDSASKTWITVGPNGTDISTDDGKNWRALHPDPSLHEAPDADRDWNALSLPFAVGPHGRIGKLDSHALDGPKNGK